MPPQQKPVDPTEGPAAAFAVELRALRDRANDDGAMSYGLLCRKTHYSRSVLAAATRGLRVPSWGVTQALVDAYGGDLTYWRERWQQARAEEGARAGPADRQITLAAVGAGRESAPTYHQASSCRPDAGVDPAGDLSAVQTARQLLAALQSRRRDLEVSYAWLARRTGLPASTVHHWLSRSSRLPRRNQFDKILAALYVGPSEVEDWHQAWRRATAAQLAAARRLTESPAEATERGPSSEDGTPAGRPMSVTSRLRPRRLRRLGVGLVAAMALTVALTVGAQTLQTPSGGAAPPPSHCPVAAYQVDVLSAAAYVYPNTNSPVQRRYRLGDTITGLPPRSREHWVRVSTWTVHKHRMGWVPSYALTYLGCDVLSGIDG